MNDHTPSNLPAVIPGSDEGGDDQSPAAAALGQERPPNVPEHVWQNLQSAGERAAERLLDELQSPTFERLKPGEKRALIELALNRAYGPPVKREVSVQLSAEMGDAVTESLASLAATDLPELRDVTPAPQSSPPAGQRRRRRPSTYQK